MGAVRLWREVVVFDSTRTRSHFSARFRGFSEAFDSRMPIVPEGAQHLRPLPLQAYPFTRCARLCGRYQMLFGERRLIILLTTGAILLACAAGISWMTGCFFSLLPLSELRVCTVLKVLDLILSRHRQRNIPRGGVVVRQFASRQGEAGSTPGGVAPKFSRVRIVRDDAAGRWVFSGNSRLPLPCIPKLLSTHLSSLPAFATVLFSCLPPGGSTEERLPPPPPTRGGHCHHLKLLCHATCYSHGDSFIRQVPFAPMPSDGTKPNRLVDNTSLKSDRQKQICGRQSTGPPFYITGTLLPQLGGRSVPCEGPWPPSWLSVSLRRRGEANPLPPPHPSNIFYAATLAFCYRIPRVAPGSCFHS
ncbi:hypothetical protein PR048_017775 [Dryococelus australis]|uniref:Uncharacterized protein n=1 Tax=Dryococelus australis TaxID=614101 RepID=A0ABQ9HAJ2_9NEOP|nr:hypothetical protein PR048_017775 [Dryococelus australis]